jgi:uncharacterized protein YqgV (UPF0045/DUF77 family)
MALAMTIAQQEGIMRTAVDISLYPLDADYVPPIKDFIARLNAHPGLDVVTNAMSTQVAGEHAHLFRVLEQETARTFERGCRAVFVLKVLGGTPTSAER